MALSFLNEEGQAAITDALYFLTIVVGLSTFLFVFSVSYGNLVDAKIRQAFEIDYTTSALKTLFYSSAPRDASKTLTIKEGSECRTQEIDYLLALVKEDYLNGADINETNLLLSKNIKTVMRPLEKSHDYLYYMFDSLGNPVFVFLHSSVDKDGSARDSEDAFYYCKPRADPNRVGDSPLNAIRRFSSGVGEIAPSTIESLFYYKTGITTNETKLTSRLLIWPSKAIDESLLNCCNASNPTECCIEKEIVVDEQYYCNPAFLDCID